MKKIITGLLCSIALTLTVISVPAMAEESENPDIFQFYALEAAEESGNSDTLQFSAGEVPRVYINTNDGIGLALVKQTGYVMADIAVVDTNGYIIHDSGQIKVRGNSTALAPKKPYNIKFDSKQNVLGMGKAKKWVLLADCYDPTFLRNTLALDFSHNIGMPYTSEHSYVELWLDGVYRGCYEITEPVDDGTSRVNINVDGNGGMEDFIIQYEMNRASSNTTYFTADEFRFEIKSPDITSEEQRLYVKNKVTEIFRIIKTLDFEEIEKVIDIDSFAKYYLINELFKNVDFGYTSAFFYYKNGILYAGPPWDYDLTAGNLNYNESPNSRLCLDTENLFADNCQFYQYLLECRDFQNAVRHVYAENFEYCENMYAEGGIIDTITETYYPLFQRNFDDTDWEISKQYTSLMRVPDPDYFENVNYLRNWLRERNQWLSDYYDIYGDDWFSLGDVDGNSEISIADAVQLQQYLMSQRAFSAINLKASDLNQDGEVDSYDMIKMRKLIINQ
ncbi:MAG: CotH kinase family protein [Ruminococcus sp.]|nr:CotH kinase family protein [Ruminococcus sp.]